MRTWVAFILAVALWAGRGAGRSFADEGATPAAPTDAEVRAAVDAYLAAKEKGKKDDPSAFRFFWKNGFKWETKDKVFTGELNGRMQADFWFFDDYDPALDTALGVPLGTAYRSAFHFRRIYLGVAEGMVLAMKAGLDASGTSLRVLSRVPLPET